MHVMPLAEVIADVSRNPRSFLILNRECHPAEIPHPSKLLLERLQDDGVVDLLIAVTTLAEAIPAGLPIGHHRERFMAGEFVPVEVQIVHEMPERSRGGQDVVGLERCVRDGLYVTIAMVTERLRACADYAAHSKMSAAVRRGEIFERLQPLLRDVSVQNAFSEGQKRVERWFPGSTAYQTMKSAYNDTVDKLRSRTDTAAVDAGLIDLVRTAGAVYAKTRSFREAQHAASAMIRELMESDEFNNASAERQHEMQARLLRERAPVQHQEMAHDMQAGPSLAQLMQAAAAMDINPSAVYANVLFFKRELDCAMYLGRVERGVGALFEPTHIKALRRCMAQADEAEGQAVVDSHIEAARCLRDLALRVKMRDGWDEFFAIAEPDGREFWITKP
jgi:hypothetical protein